jgi:inosine-uridine nucleoside N-ribohydrolase
MALDLLEASARAGATIVAIGPFTNLALLETLRPGAFEHSPVVVLGGYTGMPPVGYPQWPPGYDYNVQSDRAAARIVYERLNPLVATLNVTLATSLRRRDLPTLREGGPLSRLMARQAELHAEEHRMADRARRHHRLAPDILNFQYDSVACAAALGLSTVEVAEEPHRLDTDGEDLILTRDEAGRIRRFVTRIETEEFAKDWLERVRAL